MTGVATAPFTAYPAIDVRDGRVVRLAQGDYARETRYPADPFELAACYAAQGATWLHLVDLDAARLGGYTLAGLVRRIKRDTGLHVQSGGGVRSETDVESMLAAGVDRVVVGSLAVEQPERVAQWIGLHGAEHITVALDARCDDDGRWWPATHGWTATASMPLDAVLAGYRRAGMRHLLCTDIARDGMLSGPNLALYAALQLAHPHLAIQASGGARDAGDVRAARVAGCSGIVLGKALLEGRLELVDALAAAGEASASPPQGLPRSIDAAPPC